MNNKKQNKVLLFIKLIILFIIIDNIIGIIPSKLTSIIYNSKYDKYIIAELIALVMTIILLICSGKKYIFSTKKQGFFKTLYIGLPMVLISVAYMAGSISQIISGGELHIYNFFSLIIYCIIIGLFEEFLCRGWILNEFLENNSSTRSQVIVSIILSSLVFGIMHLSNIWIGHQDVFITILQVCNAIILGAFLGAVYFRTKNIWAVAFLHGFYDFALMLGDINILKECTTNILTFNVKLYEIYITGITMLMFVLCCIIILRKSVLNPLLDKPIPLSKEYLKKEGRDKIILIVIALLLNYAPVPNIPKDELDNSQTCYKYNEITIDEYNITTTNRTSFKINYINELEAIQDQQVGEPVEGNIEETEENETLNEEIEKQTHRRGYYNFVITKYDSKILIENTNTKDTINIEFENIINLFVYSFDNNYIILVQTYENGNSIVYYSNYMNIKNISNDKLYLKEITNSFIKIVTPDSKILGALTTKDTIYPYIGTLNNEIMIINEEGELVLVN